VGLAPVLSAGEVKNDFHCYVNGKKLGEEFYLVSMSHEADRVFLLHPGNVARVQGEAETIVKVRRCPPTTCLEDGKTIFPSKGTVVKIKRTKEDIERNIQRWRMK
jgi:hypothetical protein